MDQLLAAQQSGADSPLLHPAPSLLSIWQRPAAIAKRKRLHEEVDWDALLPPRTYPGHDSFFADLSGCVTAVVSFPYSSKAQGPAQAACAQPGRFRGLPD